MEYNNIIKPVISAPDVFLKIRDVVKMVAFARSTIYLKIQNNEFPSGVRVGIRGRRWRLSEIQNWMQLYK